MEQETLSIVSINGENWVRVCALSEDFIIGLYDLDSGKDDFSYDSAMARLKELDLDTFNRKQGFIIAIYIEAINAKLIEAGGDKFAEDWYVSNELWKPVGSSDKYSSDYSWDFGGRSGVLYYDRRCYTYFRCRPVINVEEFKKGDEK